MTRGAAAPVAKARGARRRSPGWVPNQHGAWAMLIAPVVVGSWPAPTWLSALLLLAALIGFCALYAVGMWLKSGRKPRYRNPAVAHSALTLVIAAVMVAVQPRLLSWAWVFVPLLALSLWASWQRADRSWWNDVVLVGLGVCLTFVAAGLRRPDGIWLASDTSVLSIAPGPLALPPLGWSSVTAQAGAIVLLGYFLGTVVHVKALIRERRSPWVSTADVWYHAALVVGAVVWTVSAGLGGAGWFLVAVAAALAVRAWYLVTRRRDLTPKELGIIEIVMTLLVSAAAIAVGQVLER